MFRKRNMSDLVEEDRLRQLIALGPELVSELDRDVLLNRLLQTACSVTAARYAALGILDKERRELERFVTLGLSPEQERAIDHRPAAAERRTGAHAHTTSEAPSDSLASPVGGSTVGAPLCCTYRVRHAVTAAVCVDRSAGRPARPLRNPARARPARTAGRSARGASLRW
jgi:hypothetical protein